MKTTKGIGQGLRGNCDFRVQDLTDGDLIRWGATESKWFATAELGPTNIDTTANYTWTGNHIWNGTAEFNGQVDFDADVDFNLTTSFTGLATLSTMQCTGQADFDADVDFNSTTGFTGLASFTTMACSGQVDFNGDVDFNSTSSFTGLASLTTMAVSGQVDFNGDVDMNSTASVTGNLTLGADIVTQNGDAMLTHKSRLVAYGRWDSTTTPTLVDDYGITSLTRNSTGDYTVVLDESASDANHIQAVVATFTPSNGTRVGSGWPSAVNTLDVETRKTTDGTQSDSPTWIRVYFHEGD